MTLKDVWEVFLEAIVRFWDNRFRKTNEALESLKLELEYRRRDYDKLFAAYQELLKPKEIVEEDEKQEFKPIRNIQPSWSFRARQREERSRALAREMRNKPEDKEQAERTAELEQELGVRIPQ